MKTHFSSMVLEKQTKNQITVFFYNCIKLKQNKYNITYFILLALLYPANQFLTEYNTNIYMNLMFNSQ